MLPCFIFKFIFVHFIYYKFSIMIERYFILCYVVKHNPPILVKRSTPYRLPYVLNLNLILSTLFTDYRFSIMIERCFIMCYVKHTPSPTHPHPLIVKWSTPYRLPHVLNLNLFMSTSITTYRISIMKKRYYVHCEVIKASLLQSLSK